MLTDNLKLLLQIYYRPVTAMSGILDQGSLIFSIVAAVAVSLLLNTLLFGALWAAWTSAASARAEGAAPVVREEALAEATDGELPEGAALGWPLVAGSMLPGVLVVAVLYVPAALFVVTLLERVGSFGVAFRRDYGPLLACALMAYAAAHLPFALAAPAVAAAASGPVPLLALLGGGLVYFTALMACAVRTVLGTRTGSAAAAAALGWAVLPLQGYVMFLASPCLAYYLYHYFAVGDAAWSFRARQSFKRYLQAATLNPRDADAHYHLGLIHQQRRQWGEAIERFQKAVEIDANEIDAHHQLGRIACEQRRFEDAIRHFEAVVARDPAHSRHEIWREVGATYVASGSLEHARWALEKYVEQRSHDPEGLYLLGDTLARLGDVAGARERLRACVEAVETVPPFRRREVAPFGKRARRRLTGLPPA